MIKGTTYQHIPYPTLYSSQYIPKVPVPTSYEGYQPKVMSIDVKNPHNYSPTQLNLVMEYIPLLLKEVVRYYSLQCIDDSCVIIKDDIIQFMKETHEKAKSAYQVPFLQSEDLTLIWEEHNIWTLQTLNQISLNEIQDFPKVGK